MYSQIWGERDREIDLLERADVLCQWYNGVVALCEHAYFCIAISVRFSVCTINEPVFTYLNLQTMCEQVLVFIGTLCELV